MSSELKAQRAKALEEKRKKLEEMRARRNQRSAGTKTSVSAVSASKSGNLDEYIDGLLNSAPPIAPIEPVVAAPVAPSTPVSTAPTTPSKKVSKIDLMNEKTVSFAPTTTTTAEPSPAVKQVETFTISTQTDDLDFPMEESQHSEESNQEIAPTIEMSMEQEETKDEEPTLLSEDQVQEKIASTSFSNFFISASKKVERLLGAPLLQDLLVDDTIYYNDQESKRDASTSTETKDSFISAQVRFSCEKWTKERDVTSLDWSPHHRGEVLLASYGSSSSSANSTAVKNLNHNTNSASLSRSKTEMTGADGLAILWNLTMPSRPEHVFTCGSPVLNAKFHPSEGSLVVGACYSGQMVVWDVRSGRLPVQRSLWNLLGGTSSSKSHVHPIVGLEGLDSGFVSAASDGTVNFWSLANLMEPAETVVVPGANFSSLTVAPESNTLLLGDENGSIHAVLPSTSGGSRSSKRSIVKIYDSEKDTESLGHYGNVTGLATKPALKTDKDNNTVAISKGFARGAHGLVLSCGVDWTTKLWAPAYSEKPLLNLLSHSYDYMSDVQWSPVHPSVFATASSNGTLGLWNLATSLDEPITGLQGLLLDKNDSNMDEPSHGVNRIKWSRDGRRIAAACSDTVYVLGMSDELWKPKGNEGAKVMNALRGRGLIEAEE
ncbi:hypothetical protein CTEN210_14896 [Chaetoceros tenuissimus]|uniref:Uncharacterized protein n=1 Tax=Chaetoceros tenuissimus TaxID=426638 RepID=A0AAD3D8G1_9STRA|nr:hypothetical protein CTEN210_14896 [Chaetoceros tenuissimus]